MGRGVIYRKRCTTFMKPNGPWKHVPELRLLLQMVDICTWGREFIVISIKSIVYFSRKAISASLSLFESKLYIDNKKFSL